VKIGVGGVHIWLTRCSVITDAALLAEYRDLLSVAELERQQSYALERLRHRDLLARALVRTTLSRYKDVNAKDWCFETGEHGKPEISSPSSGLRFNLSHAEDYIVLAVTHHHDIGIDIEYTARKTAYLKIAAEYFSNMENANLSALPQEARRARFYDYWTLKEAYLKACGFGVMVGLDQFGFQLNHDERPSIVFYGQQAENPADWFFWRTALEDDYRLSLAIRCGGGTNINVSLFDVIPLSQYHPH